MYLVIRNTEILPELGCWSFINTLYYIKILKFCVCILSLASNMNNISCHDICSYRDIITSMTCDIRNFYIVAALHSYHHTQIGYLLHRRDLEKKHEYGDHDCNVGPL